MRSCFEGASESRGGGRGCHGKLWGGTWPCGHLLQVRCRGDPWDPSPGEASRPPGSTQPCLGRRGQPLVRPPGAAQAHPLHRCPQPAAGEEQQHWQPPGQGGPGPPAPRLRLGLPGLPCPDGWHLQAEALQCGGACLLPGEHRPLWGRSRVGVGACTGGHRRAQPRVLWFQGSREGTVARCPPSLSRGGTGLWTPPLGRSPFPESRGLPQSRDRVHVPECLWCQMVRAEGRGVGPWCGFPVAPWRAREP